MTQVLTINQCKEYFDRNIRNYRIIEITDNYVLFQHIISSKVEIKITKIGSFLYFVVNEKVFYEFDTLSKFEVLMNYFNVEYKMKEYGYK